MLAAWLLGCGTPQIDAPPPERSIRPAVERISSRDLELTWPESFTRNPVRIAWGHSPEGLESRPDEVASSGAVVFRATPGNDTLGLEERLFFRLEPEGEEGAFVVSERRLPLRGADNTRDLGGYTTTDGRSVRWGALYRSNDLTSLKDEDVDYLSGRGITRVYDFRSAAERKKDDDRLAKVDGVEVIWLPVSQKGVDATTIRNEILTGGIAGLGLEQTMLDAYRSFVTDHTEPWAALLRDLARPGAPPSLFHCTAGKDRTGFAAALVLFSLGVPRETVFEDYLSTNRYRERYDRMIMRWVPLASLFRTRSEDMLPLLQARRAYLQASVDAMEELYGSVEAYLEGALGIDDEMRRGLAANLLR